ncbi:MAG: class I SAM-dependent methyltransferase [Parachlamydiaceae bacterium]|nr:class I SAM-dependent methyltransferase [Parachlamydiaceae bacterium]
MKDKIKQKKLDPAIEKYYNNGHEKDRLDLHQLERDRTLMILKKFLPAPPAIILDIGGGAGAYAFPLTEMGYTVHLIDPVPLHIEQAKSYETSSTIQLASCTVGDARHIEREDHCADVVLLLGPLYHLVDEEDRLKSLREAHRLLKPNGMMFAVGISRFASFMDSVYKEAFDLKKHIIKRELKTGVHHKMSEGFDFGYLHTPSELKKEMEECNFQDVSLLAIEGPIWHKKIMANLYQDQTNWQELLNTVES